MGIGTILITAVNALFPLIITIFLGYFLKCRGFLTEEFLRVGNKVVFKIGLPAMLFVNVYDIAGFAAINWNIVLYAVAAFFVVVAVGFLIAIFTTSVPERRGVVWQCTFRSNIAIIGLSLAAALGGEEAVAVAAIVSSFTVPLFNVMAVIALSVFVDGGTGRVSIRNILLNIVKNPLILGIAGGLLCLAIRELQRGLFGEVLFSIQRDTAFLYKVVSNLKAMCTPLALLVLGGQFTFSAVKELRREIFWATLGRIVIAPLIGIGCAILLSTHTDLVSCGINEYPALVAMFGSPVAVSSAVMAGNMGSDEQLATQLVVWTSVFSIVTIFVEVCVLMGMGLLAV